MKLFFLLISLCLSTLALAQQPNILWVTIEDTSPQFIGCYGNPDARTPEIDRLAQEGVRFTNAFSTGTVCSPSRSTLITGVRTFAMGTGNHRSHYPIPDFIKGFPYYLQQQGYYATNNSKTDYNVAEEEKFIREAWHESSNEAGWWNRKPGQPFFAVFNFIDSHQSRTMTHSYEWYEQEVLGQLSPDEQIAEDAFDMPPFYRDSPEMRRQFARVYNSLKLTDNKIKALLDRLQQDQLMDSTIIFFFADHGEGIPRGKTNGINLGYRVPFIVWFPPMYKHLSPWSTSSVTDELISFEDLAPSMIALAGGNKPDHLKGRVLIGEEREEEAEKLILSSDRSDNGIDMVRTITDGRYLYSRNYMPFMPEARYIRYMEIGDIKQLMRTDYEEKRLNPLQASLFEVRPAEFLFDIKQDLWETENLAEEASQQPLMKSMRKTLEEKIFSYRDVLFLPEYELAQISQHTTPYEFRQNKQQYPLEEIYHAASLSGRRGAAIARQQQELLDHQNSIVRYWAIIGLKAQEQAVIESMQRQIIEATQDDYPPVALAAAVIAYDQFDHQPSQQQLETYIKGDNKELTLMALNHLLYIKDPAPFLSCIRQIYQDKDSPYDLSAASKDLLGKMGLIPNNFEYR
ncbi:MAG: sulfatase [Cyclobacteriaceae bacterium]